MKENEANKEKDIEYQKNSESPMMTVFFILLLTLPISFFLYKLKIYNLAFFAFLFGFNFSLYVILNEYKQENPHHPLLRYSESSDIGLPLLICSIPIFFYSFFTDSMAIGIIFLLIYILGMIFSELRKAKLITIFFIAFSFITLFYSYKNRNTFLYISSTFTLAYFFLTICEYLGKNLEKKDMIKLPGFLLIISLSIGFFSNHFFNMEILNTIGLITSAFFGFFFLELTIISFLRKFITFENKDQYAVFNLLFAIIGLILFFFFILHRNIYIYIGASLSLSFGVIGLILFLKIYFSEKTSRDISFSIAFGILGITTIIFYFLFIRRSFILFFGIISMIIFIRIISNAIIKAKLELELNNKMNRKR